MSPAFKKIFSGGSEMNSDAPSAPSYTADTEETVPATDAAPAWAPPSSPAPSPSPYSSPSRLSTAKNVLNSDVSVKGSLKFTDDLLIDGIVEGEITSQGVLTIGQNAHVTAEINTSSVIIHGKLHGNIHVTDRVEMKSTAEVIGDVKAATIAIEAGAIFVGQSEVGGTKQVKPKLVSTPAIKSVTVATPEQTKSSDLQNDDDSGPVQPTLGM